MEIGCHLSRLNNYIGATISPDFLAAQFSGFDLSRITTKLTEPHRVGSGYFVVDDPGVFSRTIPYTGDVLEETAHVRDSGATNGGVSRGTFSFRYRHVAGSNLLMVKETNGREVACDAGSQIDRFGILWSNPDMAPVAPPLVVNGRDTGYPAGLRFNQYLRAIHVGGHHDPGGIWTVQARGTGTVKVEHAGSGAGHSITVHFRGGKTDTPTFVHTPSAVVFNWTVSLTASDPHDPVHDIRLIAPEPEGYRGPSFASLYEARAGDPGYFLWHPSYLDFYRPFAIVRAVDPLNINNGSHPSSLADWSDRPGDGQGPGYDSSLGLPVEHLVRFCNAINRDLWYNLPHRATDDYLLKLATYLRDHLAPGLKVYVEWSNEVWNWGYSVKRWSFARWAEELNRVKALVRVGSTASATKAAHGLRPGDPVLIACAVQPEYNGEFIVASTPDADTFTFEVAGDPASLATSPVDQHILAFRVDPLVASASSLTFSMTAVESKIRLTMDPTYFPGYKLAGGDVIAVCNCADPLANGLYVVGDVARDVVTLSMVPCQLRPLPKLVPGRTEIGAAPGLGLRARLVGSNAGGKAVQAAGVPQADDAAARWSGRRHCQAHEIMAPILGDQLVRTIGGWVNSSQHNKSIVAQYKADAGGRMPPGVQLAVAPYLYKEQGGALSVRDPKLTGAIKTCTVEATGGLAMATCGGHGYQTGDSVQIYNAAHVGYCGIFTVNRLDDNRFTYPVTGVPDGVGKPLGDNHALIRCVKDAPWFRELTALTSARGVAFATSKGHGFRTGDQVKICHARQPEYNTLAWIRKIDDDRFSYYLGGKPPSPATAPNNHRIWAYRATALDLVFTALDSQVATVLPERLADLRKEVCDPNGVSLSCYESGQHLQGGDGPPALGDLIVACNRDPRMGTIYAAYYKLLEASGIKAANHYAAIDGWSGGGCWGLVEYLGQPAIESPRYQALLELLATRAALSSEGGYSPPTPRQSMPAR